MKETDWLTSQDPSAMLEWLTSEGVKYVPPQRALDGRLYTHRQLRLFACACVRQAWHLLTNERSRQAVEVAERYADGKATAGEANIAWKKAVDDRRKYKSGGPWEAAYSAASVAEVATFDAGDVSYQMDRRNVLPVVQADILRDIFGNPFRIPDMNRGQCFECRDTRRLQAGQFDCSYCQSPLLTWNGGTIPTLAQSIYDSRDFSGMQVLGDALEEAGCVDLDILNHCRGLEKCARCNGIGSQSWPELDGVTTQSCSRCFGAKWAMRSTECVRGCWVLDLALGKS